MPTKTPKQPRSSKKSLKLPTARSRRPNRVPTTLLDRLGPRVDAHGVRDAPDTGQEGLCCSPEPDEPESATGVDIPREIEPRDVEEPLMHTEPPAVSSRSKRRRRRFTVPPRCTTQGLSPCSRKALASTVDGSPSASMAKRHHPHLVPASSTPVLTSDLHPAKSTAARLCTEHRENPKRLSSASVHRRQAPSSADDSICKDDPPLSARGSRESTENVTSLSQGDGDATPVNVSITDSQQVTYPPENDDQISPSKLTSDNNTAKILLRNTSSPDVLHLDIHGRQPAIPGIWFKHQGAHAPCIDNTTIILSDDLFSASTGRLNATASLYCLKRDSTQVDLDRPPSDVLAAMYATRSRWPLKGTLVVQTNPNAEHGQTWLPYAFESAPALDVTACVKPGRNTFRFITLSDLSDFLFILSVRPLSPEESAWRNFGWHTSSCSRIQT